MHRILLLWLLTAPAMLVSADRMVVGLTRTRSPIEAISVAATAADAPVLLIVGGLDGKADPLVTREVNRYAALKKRPYRLLAVAQANPAGAQLNFPPVGRAYQNNPESHYLWRWIGIEAPDLVLVTGQEDFGLAGSLAGNTVAGVGRIPARRVGPARTIESSVPKRFDRSEAHLEMDRRLARTPRQIAEELAGYYGHEFGEPVYIPAMALIGRLRLGSMADVERLVAPFADGSKDSLAKATSSHLAGHLVFAELAEHTGDPRYAALVRKAADLGFDNGAMKEAMPLHNEMSDAVFMACPILAKAGKITLDRKYFELALRHLEFMQKLCLRPDGIYRHSPLDRTAWGRGNAFPALGLALTLADLPPDDTVFQKILSSYRNHMQALAPFQDENGMWRQVVDLPGSYAEFSATAMIATAMRRGIRSGWLDAKQYQPRVDRAWRALRMRISSDGRLVDVCESTGKQPSVEDYLNRLAILDRDARGGGMALLLATEMAGL
jgi:unsaturated rhamnogalacturonyl hydrolase